MREMFFPLPIVKPSEQNTVGRYMVLCNQWVSGFLYKWVYLIFNERLSTVSFQPPRLCSQKYMFR